MLPVLGREVVECEQFVSVLREFLDGLWILCRVSVDELVGRDDRIGSCRGIPDFSKRRLGLAVLRLGHDVEDVADLVELIPTSG
jgi:hypothetical protein